MYKQSKPESEDYLLGKRVDKHIEEAVETVKDGMLIINLSFISAIYAVIWVFFHEMLILAFFRCQICTCICTCYT